MFEALVRPAIDRVYSAMRWEGRHRLRQVYERHRLEPGIEADIYFGLLARPLSSAALADVTVYRSGDAVARELERGVLMRDGDAFALTTAGRELALAVETAVGEAAAECWARTTVDTMPGLDALPRLDALTARLLEAGKATGGAVFHAVSDVHDPGDVVSRFASRLGALRHHRADAHRAAWRAAGVTASDIRELTGPAREAIEADTNRRDAPIYTALSSRERWELLGGLAALPG